MHENGLFLNDWNGGDQSALKDWFGIGDSELRGVEILLASYTREDIGGAAFVLFLCQGALYEINACHDSGAGGFKGQWEPEDTNVAVLRHRLEKGNLGRDDRGRDLFASDLIFLLAELEREGME